MVLKELLVHPYGTDYFPLSAKDVVGAEGSLRPLLENFSNREISELITAGWKELGKWKNNKIYELTNDQFFRDRGLPSPSRNSSPYISEDLIEGYCFICRTLQWRLENFSQQEVVSLLKMKVDDLTGKTLVHEVWGLYDALFLFGWIDVTEGLEILSQPDNNFASPMRSFQNDNYLKAQQMRAFVLEKRKEFYPHISLLYATFKQSVLESYYESCRYYYYGGGGLS